MNADIQILKNRIIELFGEYSQDDVKQFLKLYNNEDGTFSDIDYNMTFRANWPALKHLLRLNAFAVARGEYKELDKIIVKGMKYWFEHDFHNTNWYYEDLEVPWRLGLIALYCEDILSEDIMNKIKERLLTDLEFAVKRDKFWTGMNLLFFGRNTALRGILEKDEDIITKGRSYMSETIFIAKVGEEGIYYDGSFAQHMVQLYNHSYGCGFFNGCVYWLYVFSGTKFDFEPEKLEIITNLFLKGSVKMSRFDTMDFSPLGRARVRCFRDGSQEHSMSVYLKSVELLEKAHTDKVVLKKLSAARDFILKKRNNPYEECNAQYWQLKFMTHHRDNYYASVRMADKEVLGGDLWLGKLIIGEDNLGGFGAYGLSIYMCDGGEYKKIFPVWDWGLLPGTTTPHIELTLEEGAIHETEFAGNVSDGMYGLSAADMKKSYTHTGIPMPDADGRVLPVPDDAIPKEPSSASFGGKKAYFFMDEGVFHLGCDLYTDAKEDFNTTFDQSLLRGDIYADDKKIDANGMWQDINAGYVWHDNKVYLNLDGAALKLKVGDVSGNYNRIFITPTAPQEPVYNRTFTLVRPQDKNYSTYAYAVLPGVEKKGAEEAAENLDAEIIENTKDIQAICYKDKIMAVFYEPATLKCKDVSVVADKACLMIINFKENKMYVSTPDRREKQIFVTVADKKYKVLMPKEEFMRGSSVEVDL